jgi:hypothetical protein
MNLERNNLRKDTYWPCLLKYIFSLMSIYLNKLGDIVPDLLIVFIIYLKLSFVKDFRE